MSDTIDMPEDPKRGESFWKLNFAQSITIGVVLFGFLWSVFGYGRDISDNAKAIAQVSKDMATSNAESKTRIDKLEEYVRSIDRDGTQYGKGQLSNRTNEQDNTVRRVEKLEENYNKMLPIVTQMSTNLEWISGWVKVQSQQPADRPTHK